MKSVTHSGASFDNLLGKSSKVLYSTILKSLRFSSCNLQGKVGEKGEPGMTGRRGRDAGGEPAFETPEKGFKGFPGESTPGRRGDDGPKGLKGAKGSMGEMGRRGVDGLKVKRFIKYLLPFNLCHQFFFNQRYSFTI